MFPVWINDGTTEMPTDPIFYIIAKDGIYLHKDMGHFKTTGKVDNISILNECEAYAYLDVNPIPTKVFAKVLSLFRAVYEKYRSEVNIILHYSRELKQYKIEVPRQDVSGASVTYENGDETFPGFIRIGTIHSHANMSAFHSGTDQGDEEGWDGLHITLGKLGSEYFDISCSIMSGGQRFIVNPEEYIKGVTLIEYAEERTYKCYTWVNGKQVERPPETKLGWACKATKRQLKHPKTWMKKIDKYRPPTPKYPTYNYGSYGFGGFTGKYAAGYGTRFPRIDHNKKVGTPNLSIGQQSIFESYDVGEDEWNACEQCPYKEHKAQSVILNFLREATEDDLAELGLFYIASEDEKSEEKDNSFYVNDGEKPLDSKETK